MKQFVLFLLIFRAISIQASTPLIGAQVFIEPGQTEEKIESWFQIMKEHGMKTCRIRMFEAHMKNNDESWDFSLYDHAFDMAEKYDVKVLATLFPEKEGAEGIGGFKFPSGKSHEADIAFFIKKVVNHFKDHPALDTWVLQNEPGNGVYLKDQYSLSKYEEWKKNNPQDEPNHEYLTESFQYEFFWRDHTTGYLSWLASEVRKWDTENMTHVNNHMLFELLKEYDFPSWMPFLSTLGASIHAAWHLGYFERPEYNMAIAANCDLIRSAALPKPFWVTELQGGPNIFSGFDPLTPYREDIIQWLWTCIGAGAERTVFWTLNARASVHEAGEWAMIDLQDEPTERLEAAGEVAALIENNKDLFSEAAPVESPVTLLYSPHSMITFSEKIMSADFEEQPAGRKKGAHIKSVLGYYKALNESGIPCQLEQIDQFDWEKEYNTPQTVVLANMISVPSHYQSKFRKFVENGNQLIVSGLTGYFDEHMHHVFMSTDPYRQLFGATLREYHYQNDFFDLSFSYGQDTLPGHILKGIIKMDDADVISQEDEQILAVRNREGKGEVIWLPSDIGLGAWTHSVKPLAGFLRNHLGSKIMQLPFVFDQQNEHVLLRVMKSNDQYVAIFINSNDHDVKTSFINQSGKTLKKVLYKGTHSALKENTVNLGARETIVAVYH